MIRMKKNSYIIFSIIFIIFGIGFSFISYLNIDKYQDIGNVVAEKNVEYSSLQDRKSYLTLISKNYDVVTKNLAILEGKIGKSIESEDLYNYMLKFNTLGTIESIGVGPQVNKTDYVELPITLKMNTDYESLRRLFYSLKYKDRCFRVNDYNFQSDSDNKLTATINLTAFAMK